MSTTSYITRRLFGGAITANTPSGLIDASNLRQIPDNQEVFMYQNSNTSIIIEVLQAVDVSDDKNAIKFHFDSLAHDNSAENTEIRKVDVMQQDNQKIQTPPAIVLHGAQSIRKFNHRTPDSVKVLMALYRVKAKKADLVVTFNVPLATAGGAATSEDGVRHATQDFNEFVKSLTIINLGLFA